MADMGHRKLRYFDETKFIYWIFRDRIYMRYTRYHPNTRFFHERETNVLSPLFSIIPRDLLEQIQSGCYFYELSL